MANQTKFDPQTLITQANKHRQMAQQVQQQAKQALANSESTHQISTSAMTGALQSVVNDWNGVVGKVCNHLNAMADDLTKTANDLGAQDNDASRAVQSQSQQLQGFLG